MAALATRERAVAEQPQTDQRCVRGCSSRVASRSRMSILAVWEDLVGRGTRRLPRLRRLDLGRRRLRGLRLGAPLSEPRPRGAAKPTHMGSGHGAPRAYT